MLLFIKLTTQYHYTLNFLSTWETECCPGSCHIEEFTHLRVAKENKQNPDMIWQRYKLNLRKSHFGGKIIGSWSNLTPYCPPVIRSCSFPVIFIFQFLHPASGNFISLSPSEPGRQGFSSPWWLGDRSSCLCHEGRWREPDRSCRSFLLIRWSHPSAQNLEWSRYLHSDGADGDRKATWQGQDGNSRGRHASSCCTGNCR